MAAERLNPRGFAIKHEPTYVDTAILRWQACTSRRGAGGRRAPLGGSGGGTKAGEAALPPDVGGAPGRRTAGNAQLSLGAAR